MINIYGTPTCSWCTKAKETAEAHGLPYQYFDVTEGTNMEIFAEKFPNATKVPQIEWHGKHVGGYTEFALEIENTRNYGDGPV